jgi:hypothetical protein
MVASETTSSPRRPREREQSGKQARERVAQSE